MSGSTMTLVVLIRHAHSSANASGVLSGRTEGVHLSPKGLVQSKELSKRLGDIGVKTLRVSPMIRCLETIKPWSTKFGIEPSVDEGLIEMDYGRWTGKKLRTLSKDPLWKKVQSKPSQVTFPDGEAMRAMQRRAMKSVGEAAALKGKGAVILVSHGDVIKAIIASTLGLHLDQFQKIVIDPASISIINFSENSSQLLMMNNTSLKVADILGATSHKRLLVGGGSGSVVKEGKK